MSGIKEISEVVKFVCAVANAIGVGDAAHLVPLLYKLPSAVDGIGEIPDEMKDLSQDEIDEIVKMVKDELDLPQDKIEMAIEESIAIAVQLYALVVKLKA